MKTILDISYYQDPEKINYDVIAEQYREGKIGGVIIRCGYGVRKDTAFETHYAELKIRGVPVGVYHFIVEYKTVDEQLAVVKQTIDDSKKIIDLGNGYGQVLGGFELGFWADVELENGAPALTRATVIEYVTKAESHFGEIGIYTGAWCWNPIMGTDNPFSSRKLWVGSYSSSPYLPIGWSDYWLWQYTSSGRLDGYDSNLDMSRITDENYKTWVGDDIPDEIVPLEIPLFSQKDPKWSFKNLGTSSVTIGAYGCLVTNVAMICSYFGKDTDPDRLNQALVAVDGYESKNLLRHSYVAKVYPDIQVDWTMFLADPQEKDIDLSLKAGLPVIVQVDYNTATSALDQHWVIITGKDTNGYLIADPIDGAVKYLSRYANKAYRMVVYEKHPTEEVLFKAKVIAGALNVRSTPVYNPDNPDFNWVDLLNNGDVVNVFEVADNGWFRIGIDRWCSGSEKYMEKIEDEPTPPVLTIEQKVDILWEEYLEKEL